MPESNDDPYRGHNPASIWDSRLTSYVGGLRQRDSKNEVYESWSTCKSVLDEENIGPRISGKKIIELGPGVPTDFRDYCVKAGADEYIGVDLFDAPSNEPPLIEDTRVAYRNEDLLQFLTEQPSDSAVIAAFVVFCDEMIRRRQCERLGLDPEAIIEKVAKEVYRVQIPGEHLIAFGARDLFLKHLQLAGFVRNRLSMLFLKSS